MRPIWLAVAAALAVGCSSADGGTSTGLRGLVRIAPTKPVCSENEPCSRPAGDVKLIFSRSGKVVATATTNGKGWYRVTLRPGSYSVGTDREGPGRGIYPQSATVASDRVKRRDFYLDTGIL